MTREERHSLILETLNRHEMVQVNELAIRLGVSAVTVRKDLSELENANKLYRSHGRAILINPYTPNKSVNKKEKLCSSEKMAIAMLGASLIADNDSIILASGSTVHALAHCLKPKNRLTVVSASVLSSAILAANENIDIVQLGGSLRHSSLSAVGVYAEQALDDFYCSKLFMGVDGIDIGFGITTTDLREAQLNRKMMATAQKTIVLADHTKFSRRGFSKIADLEEVDTIITDPGIADRTAQQIENLGIELLVAQDSPLSDTSAKAQ